MYLLKVALIFLLVDVVHVGTKFIDTWKPPKRLVPPGECPFDDGQVSNAHQHRVANGRFYIIHHENRSLYTPIWKNAFKLCNYLDMKLAKVDHLTTFWHIMNFWRTHNKGIYKDTWYWIAAKYDSKTEVYRWHNSSYHPPGDRVKYNNFFYHVPRPTGVGAHHNVDRKYVPNAKGQDYTQCLTLAFPWPINETRTNFTSNTAIGTFGFDPTMDERQCTNEELRHAICETEIKKCNAPDPGPYVLSEGKEDYFDHGNWIVGNRMYIINWGQRTFNESNDYCEKLGLEMYNPGLTDQCLIPFLKLWARNVSVSQWWTHWNYRQKNWTFFDYGGKFQGNYSSDVSKNYVAKGFNTSDNYEGRSSKKDAIVCVALQHHFEFKSQTACPPDQDCHWHFLLYAAANCNNYHGVICQHKDNRENPKRTCSWKAEWISKEGGITKAIKETAVVPFGFETNKQYLRSRYKQTFGSLYCPPGYSMVRDRNEVWWREIPKILKPHEIFLYDYGETYWVVDKDKFKKPKGSKCAIAVPQESNWDATNIQYNNKSVPCTEWHFYLCKRRFKAPIPLPSRDPDFKEPQYNWNSDRPTPRHDK